MKKKLTVFVIAFSLLLSLMFVTVDGEAFDKESFGEIFQKTESESIEIYDWHDLNQVRDDLEANYALMEDLDENTEGYAELVDTEDGWNPIGEDGLDPFTGTFDGNGHEISDLYINRSETYDVGLFGYIEYGAEVTNLGIVDAKVSGNHYVGALVGYNSGSVSKSYATGSVRGIGWIGGLVGWNFEGTILGSYADGEVDGEDNVGGLVGMNLDSKVSNSYAAADVSGLEYIGGLVGYNDDSIISNSYAVGNVRGLEYVGGLVGYNYDGTISNSYAVGDVSEAEFTGGLVGRQTRGTISNSFWDEESSGTKESAGGTGKTTVEMKDVATYTVISTEGLEEPWDFVADPYDDESDEDIWDIDLDGIINDGYPFLAWEDEQGEYRLNIYVEGQGSVVIKGREVGDGWAGELEEGENVELSALPYESWYFEGWTGDYEGKDEEITITMDRDKEITAVFEDEDIINGNDDISGFTSTLLLLAVVIAIVIYKKR